MSGPIAWAWSKGRAMHCCIVRPTSCEVENGCACGSVGEWTTLWTKASSSWTSAESPSITADQVARGGRAVDRPRETLAHQVGQVAAVIHVRMAEHHGIDGARLEGKMAMQSAALGAGAAHQPAVEQDLATRCLDQVHRAGHRIGGAPEGHAGRRGLAGGERFHAGYSTGLRRKGCAEWPGGLGS